MTQVARSDLASETNKIKHLLVNEALGNKGLIWSVSDPSPDTLLRN